jgi:multidrug resistance efflux pump
MGRADINRSGRHHRRGDDIILRHGGSRQSTNDAYVEGRVVRISPKVSGQVISLRLTTTTP